MTQRTTASPEDLRRRAERLLTASPLPGTPLADAQALVHELQVHQAELQLQNEELLRTQAERASSEARYRGLFEGAPVAYVSVARGGLIKEANAATERLFATSRAMLVGQAAVRLAVDSEQVRLHEFLGRAWLKTDEPAPEFRFHRRAHGAFPGRLECRVLDVGDEEPLLLCAVIDLSLLREASAKLEVSEERYRRLFEGAREGLLVLEQGVVVEANPGAARLLGVPTIALAGRDAREVFLPEFQESGLALAQATPHQARSGVLRLAVRAANGEAIPVEASAAVVTSSGAPLVLLTLRDLREELKAEAERTRHASEQTRMNRLEAMGRWAGSVAHEVNNTLSVVMAVASLGSEEYTGAAAEDFGDIFEAARRGRELTQRLLGTVRNAPVRFGPVAVAPLAREVGALVRKMAPAGVKVVEATEDEALQVHGEALMLHQAVLNLGLNALDAMGTVGGTLTVRVRSAQLAAADLPSSVPARAGAFAALTVEDTGPGFGPDALTHAFEPFFTTKAHAGTGLGLATVWRTAVHHAGFVRIENGAPGARVTVFLPAVERSAPTESTPAPPLTPGGLRGVVLVVDDEPALLSGLVRHLKRLGLEVLSAPNGEEALERFGGRAREVTLALVDQSMPGMSGVDTIAKLRGLAPELPAVLMSGFARELVPATFLEQPRTDFLAKPFEPRQLAELVRCLGRPSGGEPRQSEISGTADAPANSGSRTVS